MRKSAGCVLVASLVLSQLAAGAEVFKCQDDQGNITYGQTPCKGQKRLPYEAGSVTTIEAPPTRVSTPTPAPADSHAPANNASANKGQVTPNPNAPAGDNCNMDNPNYDPVFCQPNNLRSVYGPTDDNNRGQIIRNLPRVNPLPGGR